MNPIDQIEADIDLHYAQYGKKMHLSGFQKGQLVLNFLKKKNGPF